PVGTGGARAAGEQYRRQRSWPLVSREGQGPGCGAFECVSQIAWASIIVRELLAKPSRTAVYGPVRTVVWQGSAGDRRPYADQLAVCPRVCPTGNASPGRVPPKTVKHPGHGGSVPVVILCCTHERSEPDWRRHRQRPFGEV